MHIESTLLIQAPAASVFALYADVARWTDWDPDVKSASLDGPFATGSTGVIVPHGGPKSKVVFDRVVPDRGFHVLCKLPLCRMRFEHELTPVGSGTQSTHRVVFEGPLAPLFGRLIGSGMRKTQPHALQSLKRVAEERARRPVPHTA
ncbi:MAG: hypothetical protein RLY78_1360 [Pseudomonadota bacterium]|jgi:uncharacterized protein YndB with AHSA1/START domain|uniref:SRPBCC family protein n=1 Tax=Pseudaquabacterium rugosum TaxID=2984194 RepID=A0ABU9BDN7_9BURK